MVANDKEARDRVSTNAYAAPQHDGVAVDKGCAAPVLVVGQGAKDVAEQNEVGHVVQLAGGGGHDNDGVLLVLVPRNL